LLNPPSRQPTRIEFGLPEHSVISKEYRKAIISIPNEYIQEGLKEIVNKEKLFQHAMTNWIAYKRWENERNPIRKELERKFGYDTKSAMHLARLCKMAKEILIEKKVHVFRPDREELKAIRNGAWSFDQLLEFAENIDAELDVLYEKSDLRSKPDLKGISRLYKEICEEHFEIHGMLD